MTPRIPESVFILMHLVGNAMPPRDPNDDDGEEEEQEDAGEDDREPAVIREPDENQ